MFGTLSFGSLVNLDILDVQWVLVERGDITRIRVGKRVDMFQGPESGITSPTTFAVLQSEALVSDPRRKRYRKSNYLVGHTSNTDRLLVDTDKRGRGVQQVEGIPELNVLQNRHHINTRL